MGDDWSTLFNVNELKMIRSEEKHSGESESSSLEIIKQVCPFRFGKLQLEKRFHRQSRNELSILSPEHIQVPKNRNDSARQKLLIIPNFLRSPKTKSFRENNSIQGQSRIESGELHSKYFLFKFVIVSALCSRAIIFTVTAAFRFTAKLKKFPSHVTFPLVASIISIFMFWFFFSMID